MPWIREIFHQPDLNLNGTFFYREAVRAIVFRKDHLLMVHSRVDGDYKFPGGGLNPGETHVQALKREMAEEAGARLLEVRGEAGRVTEYDRRVDGRYDLFKMLSVYYICRIDTRLGSTHLDPYEDELGFVPVWISVQDALMANRSVLQAGQPPRWTQREILVLEILASGEISNNG